MDPTLWDVDAFNKQRKNDCVTFLTNEVPSYIPPKLKNFDRNITDRPRVPKKKMEKKKKLIVTTKPSPFDAGITYILTNLLELPFTHPVALALQHDMQFKVLDEKYKGCECFELLNLDLNAVFLFRYPTTNSNNTTVMKILPERKARSLQGIIAYHIYLLLNNDDTCDDPTQWDVTAFKKWRRVSCSAYVTNRKPYDLSREQVAELYTYYEKSTEAISADVVNRNREIGDNLNVNVSVVLSEDDIQSNSTEAIGDNLNVNVSVVLSKDEISR